MRITVLQRHIDEAKRVLSLSMTCYDEHCPISLAARELGVVRPQTSRKYVWSSGPLGWRLPDEAVAFVDAFDTFFDEEGPSPLPIAFEMTECARG